MVSLLGQKAGPGFSEALDTTCSRGGGQGGDAATPLILPNVHPELCFSLPGEEGRG